MQFSVTTLVILFTAAVSALPADVTPRQTTFTELALWNNSGCQSGGRIGTATISNTAECQNFQSGIVSATVDIDISAGCQIEFFIGPGCSSPNTIVVPRDTAAHCCFEFGPGKNVGSAKVSGTCA